MTRYFEDKLRSIVDDLIDARVALAFIGCQDPEQHPYIEAEAVSAQDELDKFIKDQRCR